MSLSRRSSRLASPAFVGGYWQTRRKRPLRAAGGFHRSWISFRRGASDGLTSVCINFPERRRSCLDEIGLRCAHLPRAISQAVGASRWLLASGLTQRSHGLGGPGSSRSAISAAVRPAPATRCRRRPAPSALSRSAAGGRRRRPNGDCALRRRADEGHLILGVDQPHDAPLGDALGVG